QAFGKPREPLARNNGSASPNPGLLITPKRTHQNVASNIGEEGRRDFSQFLGGVFRQPTLHVPNGSSHANKSGVVAIDAATRSDECRVNRGPSHGGSIEDVTCAFL